ncbi:hypothetical protein A3K86_09355 [Photobacterium jeanii]|uniref:Chromosome partitioning protein ParA n=1 Tax=Photobacterium jeanii TaxID=858640 RepID=A0A178KHR3_9GAMM|nr:hypothetical protein [Photobacterium jeanii]OAN16809.1 hypothetical protein A3K86_09355 [Photobacterium jeanii]PST88417.1 hypothetical protein C9I91_17665 [Photobacterium jeanii]
MKPWLSQEYDQLFQQIHQHHYRVLTLAGASPQCGTSTQAFWLAQRLSQDQSKTLLIDLDLAGSGQGYPSAQWQCDGTEQSNAKIVINEHLDILPKPPQQTILALRQPQSLNQAFELWREQYQYIICDVGSINTANWRNLAVASLGYASDASILCLAAGKTTESDLLASVQRLEQSNINLIGTLINDRANPTLASEIQRVMNQKARWLPQFLKRKINQYLVTNPLLQGKYQ